MSFETIGFWTKPVLSVRRILSDARSIGRKKGVQK